MSNWVICAGKSESSIIQAYLLKSGTRCSIKFEANPFKLRQALKYMPLRVGVIVGEGIAGPQAVNVAAAIAQDECALEVVLIVKDASGSLRSRAKRAGITRVVTFAELESAPAAGAQDTARLPATKALEKAESTGDGLEPDAIELDRTGEVSLEDAGGPPKREGVPVITFVSGRGGVGKSTICAMAGYIASSWGMQVALLDLDLAFGNLSSICGIEHSADLAGYIESKTEDKPVNVSHGAAAAERLEVYGPCRVPEYAEVVQPYAASLIAALTQTHDLVLVDTTNNWGDAVASAAQEADRVAIVTDERPGAVAALARCGGLAVRLGVARTRIVRVMNGCDPKRRDEEFVARAASGLECAREVKILDGDLEAMELLACGRVADLISINNPLASSTATGLAQILHELGKLPDCESAQSALRGGKKRAKRLFSRSREAAVSA